jgi:hypothetical protein
LATIKPSDPSRSGVQFSEPSRQRELSLVDM